MSSSAPSSSVLPRLAYRPLVAALVLTCGLALAACGGKGGAAEARADNGDEAPDPIPVEVQPVTRRAIAASYTGTAPLEPRAESQVVAKTSGVALAVLVEEGDRVRAGQALVRLDPDRAVLQAAQSAAMLAKLEASYRRSQQLAAQQLVSAADDEQLRFDLENARATNRLARLELSYANVTAPISGVVASRSIKTGNFVQINTPIFRIVDTSRLEAVLNVPERELATLKAGQAVTLQVDALPGRTFTGEVDRVSPVVDAGSGTFRVICSFAGSDGSDDGAALQPGMFGRIGISYDQRRNARVIPRVALLEDEGEAAVFVVRDGKASRVAVELGYAEGPWVEIRKGLDAGEQVVVAGKAALREGTVVQVIGAAAKKPAVAAAPAPTTAN